jgi:hypothetical protein
MPREQFYNIGLCALVLAWAPTASGPIDQCGGAEAPPPQNLVDRRSGSPARMETVRSVAALPPHVAAQFADPAGFAQLPSGDYLLFDRRAHTVFRVDRGLESVRPLVSIGIEPGRILTPFGFDLDPTGLLVLGDAPGSTERIQVFSTDGTRLGGFSLRPRPDARVQFEGLTLNGVTTLRVTANQTILLNQPETGSLITEYDFSGQVVRTVGRLRGTGHETSPPVHLALNSGLPLPIPSGGYYFVFRSGAPYFQRYSANGTLMFDRAIQGRELDRWVQEQPTSWDRMAPSADTTLPIVRPLVRTAAVDSSGHLWVSFSLPFTYVYDDDGEKRRTIQLYGAGPLAPTSLSFAADGRLLATPGGYIFKP